MKKQYVGTGVALITPAYGNPHNAVTTEFGQSNESNFTAPIVISSCFGHV